MLEEGHYIAWAVEWALEGAVEWVACRTAAHRSEVTGYTE